jgi:hypothetical protein
MVNTSMVGKDEIYQFSFEQEYRVKQTQLLFKIDILIPGTDISAISSRALQTGVAVPSSHNAS